MSVGERWAHTHQQSRVNAVDTIRHILAASRELTAEDETDRSNRCVVVGGTEFSLDLS